MRAEVGGWGWGLSGGIEVAGGSRRRGRCDDGAYSGETNGW